MKKILIAIALLLFTTNAHAMILGVDWTGNEVARANDTWTQANSWTGIGLGGPVGNQYIVFKAYEFTVDQPAIVNYLSVDASVVPYSFIYENAREEYISQRLAEGATPEQIGLEINGDGIHPPLFVGPSQSIGVNFSLIKGSIPLRPTLNDNQVQPSSNVLASSSYAFTTDDSLNNTGYTNLLIPFSPFNATLEPNNTYWLWAEDPQFSGLTFNYSTNFIGERVVPEPATLLLFGTGLVGTFLRKRKA